MSSDFEGKVVAITGGASGIGLALAKLLYSAGAKISICDVNESNLSAAVSTITFADPKVSNGASSHIMTTLVDVRSPASVDAWIEKTVSQFGSLDGAANLAGVMGDGLSRSPIDIMDDGDWKFVLDVNLTGTMNCLRAEIRAMKKAGKPASVVNTASIAGLVGFKNNSAYVASKHGVVGLTRSVAKEVGELGIRVNAVAPGPIDTPMVAEYKSRVGGKHEFSGFMAMGRDGKAEEVAEAIAWLLSSKSTFVTGNIQSVDGGWNC